MPGAPKNILEKAELTLRKPRRRRERVSRSLTILATLAVVAALYLARAFVVPLLIGVLLSYTLRPIVSALHRLRIPQPIGAALVLLLLTGGSVAIAYSLADDAVVMIEKLPDAARRLRLSLSSSKTDAPTALQNVQEAASELQRVASDASSRPGSRSTLVAPGESGSWLRNYALAQSALLLATAAQAPIVFLLAYFLLASGDHFRRKLAQFVGPSRARTEDVVSILNEIENQVQRYLFVTLAANVLVGLFTWLCFRGLGVSQAGVWGVFAGVMHFVPYLGAVVVACAAGIAAMMQFGSASSALLVMGTVILVETLIGMVFVTWLQGRFAHVNAAVLFIALLFFDWLWGAAGLLLCAPIVAIVKVVCDRVDALNPLGELLGG